MNRLLEIAKTGDYELDRDLVRGNIVRAAADVVGATTLEARPQLLRALMAIANNEQPAGGWPEFGPFQGDSFLAGGPSVGILEVYRSTAKDLGLWSPSAAAAGDEAAERAEFARFADRDSLPVTTAWGVRVFLEKLRIAGDDVAAAIRKFNGGGVAADNYQARALQFASRTWSEDFTA